MVAQQATGPGALLPQCDRGRANGPLAGGQQVVGYGRQQERGSDAPDPATRGGSHRREEQALHRVAETRLAPGTPEYVALVDDQDDSPRDEVLIVIQRERDHRLYVEHPLPPIVCRADVAVVVQLQGHADLGHLMDAPGLRVEPIGRHEVRFFCRTGHPLLDRDAISVDDLDGAAAISVQVVGASDQLRGQLAFYSTLSRRH